MTDDCTEDGCADCLLAEKTVRPRSDFDVSGYEIPRFDEQETVQNDV